MKKIFMAIASVVLACGIGVAAVGCAGGFDPEGAINLYNREPGSGTRDAFLELIEVKEEDLATSSSFDSTGAVLTAVAGDPNGIGYISLGSVDDTVNALKVDGVEASAANVINETYGISRPFEIMYQQEKYEENDLLRDFVTYLESSDAQKVISDYGYVSVYSDADPYVAPTEDFKTTTLNIGGSTSVQPLMSVDEKVDGKDIPCLITAYKEACGQDVQIKYDGTGSGTGITNAGDGTYDIGFASKAVSQSDFSGVKAEMVIYQLCKDGIAVIVNKDNTVVTDVTIAQLADIYTGVITTWNELSGDAE